MPSYASFTKLAAAKVAAQERQAAAIKSQRRIAAGGQEWYHVLDISSNASVEDVKRVYHELALLHHPDKGVDVDSGEYEVVKQFQCLVSVVRCERKHEGRGTCTGTRDCTRRRAFELCRRCTAPRLCGDTFKRVQQAYEQGIRSVEAKAVQSLVPASTTLDTYVVSLNASKADLRNAVDLWETRYDKGQVETTPDDIEEVSCEELSAWLSSSECLVLDTRELSEKHGSNRACIPEALAVSYLTLIKLTDEAVPHVGRLQRDSRKIVAYSTHGGIMGNCGMTCCILIDVFGIAPHRMRRLEDGWMGWKEWTRHELA